MRHLVLSHSAMPGTMSIKSSDIDHGDFMSKTHEANVFGGNGDNQSPQLSWDGAPEGTKAFAIFAYDPDAPTGSGFWHWQVINIPANITSLESGAGDSSAYLLPKDAEQLRNDYGVIGFGGACPPEGRTHRYQFTVYALSQTLEIPEGASAAVVGFMVNAASIGSATLEALYKR